MQAPQYPRNAVAMGMMFETICLATIAFVIATMFPYVLTPLGWMNMTIRATFAFGLSFVLNAVLLWKTKTIGKYFAAMNGLIAMLCFFINNLVGASIIDEHKLFFLAFGYISASLLTKILYYKTFLLPSFKR